LEGDVISIVDVTKKRLHQFHQTIKASCGSQPAFHRNFLIDRRHIDQSAEKEPDSLRQNLGDEQIAAVILGGKLNEEKSRMSGTLPEIVVEAKFKDFPWLDLKDDGREKIEPVVCVRVVVREGGRKHVVVTAYVPRQEILDPDDFSEVTYEIW